MGKEKSLAPGLRESKSRLKMVGEQQHLSLRDRESSEAREHFGGEGVYSASDAAKELKAKMGKCPTNRASH